jgi:hypothetical protein
MKQKRKTKLVHCKNCDVEFEKAISEINRNKNGNHFCSLNCTAEYRNDINRKNLGNFLGNAEHLKNVNHKNTYTGFREFINRAKQRNKLGDLTLDDLKEQWKKQNGICPYTGIELKLPQARKKRLMFEMASLDRIDSSKLYEKNNVVFVSTPINFMKNSMTEEETVAYCKKIALFWSIK